MAGSARLRPGVLVLGALALLFPLAAAAFDIGPPVGSVAPRLHATDAAGKPADYGSIGGRKGAVLVFFRSAKWCSYCQKELIEYRDAQAPLEARGYRLVAISYDPPDVTTAFATKRQIGFDFLSDPGSVTIDAFRLRDPQYAPGSLAYGVPQPSIFVIDRHGVIRAKLAEQGFKTWPHVPDILAAVDAISVRGAGAH
jgi:peroxiredoxin